MTKPAVAEQRRHRIEYEDLAQLLKLRAKENPKKHDKPLIRESLVEHGMVAPVLVDDGQDVVGLGHGRLEVLDDMKRAGDPAPVGIEVKGGRWFVPVVRGVRFKNRRALLKYIAVDNRSTERGGWDAQKLLPFLKAFGADFKGSGFGKEDLSGLLAARAAAPVANGKLSEQFLVPPFTVLDARQGYWQERKRAWLSLGIKSEIGRGGNLIGRSIYDAAALFVKGHYSDGKKFVDQHRADGKTDAEIIQLMGLKGRARTFGQDLSKGEHVFGPGKTARTAAAPNPEANGTSIFDPVLCELVYIWFSPKGGSVLDPFAGGSVRGVVASKLGRRYTGIDLRDEQVLANRKQAKEICRAPAPVWLAGDSVIARQLAPGQYDLVFSCPPYGDLEVYSDDPRDVSTLDYPAFVEKYRRIVAGAVGLLKQDRFAAFVVGDIRDKRGFYRRFVADTQQAFEDAGARLYNEAILVTAVGSLSIRAGRAFSSTRKLGKTHQQLLIFCKGDPASATKACGSVRVEVDLTKTFGEPVD